MELAAAAHDERVRGVGVRDTERDVALELRIEPLAELAACHELPLTPGERAVVDAEAHAKRRLLDADRRQRSGIRGVGDGVADPGLDARDRHDVTGLDIFDLFAREALEREERRDLRRAEVALMVDPGNILAATERAALQPADGDAADVVVV